MAPYSEHAFQLVSPRLGPFADLFTQEGTRTGIAPELLAALGAHESNGNPNAIGAPNANGTRDYGLMQINDSNYDGDPTDLLDPATNIRIGADVMAAAVKATGGDVLWAISQYNRGSRATYLGTPLVKGRLPDGTFPNAAYVADVRQWFQALRAAAGKSTDLSSVTAEAGIAGSPLVLFILLGLLASVLLRALVARHH